MYNEERSCVNERAESVLNVVAIVVHAVGALLALLFLFGAFSNMTAMVRLGASVGSGQLIMVMVMTVLIYVLCGLLPWAVIKVVLNMSYSLMYISDDVHEIKNHIRSKS